MQLGTCETADSSGLFSMKQLRQLYLWRQPASDSILAFEQRLGRPGWVAFVHLAWTAWVFLMPAFSQPYFGYDLRWALLTLSSFPLFLWLYVVNVCASHRAAQRASLGMVALCVVLLPWYPGGLTYFVFGCVMYRPRLAGLVRQVLAQLVAALMVTGLALLIGYPWQALVWIVVITPIIGILVAVDRGNRERDAALKQSQDEVRRLAAVAERERISRDLHDLLGHTLSMVALKSDLAERLVDNDPDAARAEMAALADIARHALSEVRRAVSGMRATGIAAELAAARLLLETAGIEVDCQISPDRGRSALSPGAEHALAMTIREAATNVHRHAAAAAVTIALDVDGEAMTLDIADDGVGGRVVPGTGLTGMRERIESVGGRLSILSGIGQGLQVSVSVPLSQNHAEQTGKP